MCVFAYFFCLLSAEKLLIGDEKHRKKHVVSSLWYTEALQFVRVHACITLKRKCRTNSKHDTQKTVSIRQRKIQRRGACVTMKRHKTYKHKAKKKNNGSGVRTACMCQNENSGEESSGQQQA